MEERTKIKLEPTPTGKIIEITGWATIVAIWGIILLNYRDLPDTIPLHFDAQGNPDGFGMKGILLSLPVLATLLLLGLTVLNKYPYLFNYPIPVTRANALKLYTNATNMIRVLKLAIAMTFLLVSFEVIQSAKQQSLSLGIWILPVILGLIFIPTFYFGIKSFTIK